jgi:hypothetical protein
LKPHFIFPKTLIIPSLFSLEPELLPKKKAATVTTMPINVPKCTGIKVCRFLLKYKFNHGQSGITNAAKLRGRMEEWKNGKMEEWNVGTPIAIGKKLEC